MKVVNLYGGPSSGKSTTAAGIFHELKMAHKKAELVGEYAKDLVYSEILHILSPNGQELIFAEQHHRVERLRGKVDFAIADSPLLLSTIYGTPKATTPAFHELVVQTYKTFDNLNFFIHRPQTFEQDGARIHNEEQSKEIDRQILSMLSKYNEPVVELQADKFLVRKILSHLDI